LKSSFRRKNHSKSFFIGNKNKNNNNNKSLKDSSEKNSRLLIENTNKVFLDKNSFNSLEIIPNNYNNQKPNADYYSSNFANNSYLVSNSNNQYFIDDNEINSTNQNLYNKAIYATTYDNINKLANDNSDAEPKAMLSSILDKYKNENTNITNNFISGGNNLNNDANKTSIILQSRYINPYAPLNTDSNKDTYACNLNGITNNSQNLNSANNSNKLNKRYYAQETYSNNINNYNTITNIPNCTYYSNNQITNNQNKIKENNKNTEYYPTNYYDKNTNQTFDYNIIINKQINENPSYKNNKIAENLVNDETFGDNKFAMEKDAPKNISTKLTENNNPCSNLIELNKDLSVLSSSLIIENSNKNVNLSLKENKENALKKTKSFSRLKNSNKGTETKCNNKKLSIFNFISIFFF
jgi:hypothetical protein